MSAAWKLTTVQESLDLDNVSYKFDLVQGWDAQFITIFVISTILTIINFFILPIFFLDGKTWGKKIFKLEVLQLGEKPLWQSILKREIPLAIFSLSVSIITFTTSRSLSLSLIDINNEIAIANENQPNNKQSFILMKEFLFNLKKDKLITTSEYSLHRASSILRMISFILIIGLFLTVVFSKEKRGIHDMMAETVIVDGWGITTMEQYEKRHKGYDIADNVILPEDELKKSKPKNKPIDLEIEKKDDKK